MGLFKSADDKLQEEIFNLRMTSKNLNRQAKKAEQEHEKEKLKVKKMIEDNKPDFARVYAETAIRKRNESLRYMKIAAKLDGVAARMKSASMTKENMKTMSKVNSALGTAMKSMDLEKVQAVMDRFEMTSDKLDVMTNTMDGTLDSALASGAPTNQVETLIQQVADQHELDVSQMLADMSGPASRVPANNVANIERQKEQDLDSRLAALRN